MRKITKLEKKKQKERAPMLYDLTTLQREANTRYGFSARRTLSAAQRLYEEHKALTYPRTNSRYLTTDMIERDQADRRARRRPDGLPQGRGVRDGPGGAAAGARGEQREGDRPPRDHPDALRAQRRADGLRRQTDLRHGRAALPRGLPPRSGVREHENRDDGAGRAGREGRRVRVPHARQAAARARLARGLRRGGGRRGETGKRESRRR